LQGGMHPEVPFESYEDLLRGIRRKFPGIKIHGFSPPEIHHFSQLTGLPVATVLGRLKAAGLGSLPGGGAEILVDRVRQAVSPCKVGARGWLEVCRQWHELGGRGSATMMFGHLETLAERIEHLTRLRDLQDATGGFTAFIHWTFQPGNTPGPSEGFCTNGALPHTHAGAWDYLRTLAVARLFLDNIPYLQASWVTQGRDIAQLALLFGANDLGSTMLEENVVAAAGTRFSMSPDDLRRLAEGVGFQLRRRDFHYRLVS